MAITSRKITTYAKNIVDLSDTPNKDGITAAQLKAMFDGRTDEEVKTSINGIVDDLTATTDGASGADQIGATPLTGGTGNTVQEVLEEIDGSTVHNAGDETVAGVKTFSSSPIVPTPTTDMQASTKKYVDDLDALNVHLAGVETVTGVKTFSVSPIVPAPTTDTQASTKKYVDDTDGARKTYVDNLDALAVHLAGNETITGIKTFSASPVVPAPTTDTQAATKKYVDDADALKVDITDIVNDLTTGGTAVPLSAEQGKTLQGEVGTLASLSTTEKGSLVGAINEVDDHADTNATSIGALASLTTTEKTNLVGAINEVDADVGTNATAIGTLASLTTTEKTNLVGAINELDTDKVETSAITNTLTETGTGKVLDASQGKTLSDKIGNQTYTEKNYIADDESATASINKLDMQLKDTADNVSGLQTALDGKVDDSQVLTDVPANAKFTDTVYTHPTTAGNKHIPTGGASGQVLKYSASGTAVWGTDNDTVTTINGKTGAIAKADITALGIPAQDTVYTHPATHSISEVSGLQDALDGKQASLGFTPLNANLKGAVNGVAELDEAGKVPVSQLPSYVDDVLEYDNQAGFPTTGETGKIYVAKDTNKTYRWSGSGYVEISASLALGTTSSTAFRGDYGQTAYTHSQESHAPADAQKNSDITKAEIEDKLTGTITTHSHTVTKGDVGLGNVTNESKATMFTSPTFTGTPLSTTATKGTNTTQIATTSYVMTALGDYVKTTDTIDGGTF